MKRLLPVLLRINLSQNARFLGLQLIQVLFPVGSWAEGAPRHALLELMEERVVIVPALIVHNCVRIKVSQCQLFLATVVTLV